MSESEYVRVIQLGAATITLINVGDIKANLTEWFSRAEHELPSRFAAASTVSQAEEGAAVMLPPAGPPAPPQAATASVRAATRPARCSLMAGYLTLDGFRPLASDEFHETGDLGCLDTRGRLHLVGRSADMIKSRRDG